LLLYKIGILRMHFRGFFIVVHLLFIAHSARSTHEFELDPQHYSHEKYNAEQMSAEFGFPENTVISHKKDTALSWTRVYKAGSFFGFKYAVMRYALSGKKEYALAQRVVCSDQQAAWDIMHDCFVNRKKDLLLPVALEDHSSDQRQALGSKKIPASSGCCK